MNNTPAEAEMLVTELIPLVADANAEVVVCPTFVCLETVKRAIKGTNIKLGAQNLHFEKKGAFTGEVSAEMLTAIGVDYVIIGHRREDSTLMRRTRRSIKRFTPLSQMRSHLSSA